jgi:putative tryptophan/tyrosine transport system substrate-binding protein
MRALFAAFLLCVAFAAAAQQPRIGVVTLGVAPSSPTMQAFRHGLKEHGYIEGKNIAVEYRFAQGRAEALPQMVAELLRLKVTLLVTESASASIAAAKATKEVPIVQAAGVDPVMTGLAASLARPGGNVTGLTLSGADRTAKQLQLLKESVPAAANVAVIYNSNRPGMQDEMSQAMQMARALGLAPQYIEVRTNEELFAALDALSKNRPSAVVTIGHGMLFGHSKRIADFATANRLPGVFPEREFVEAGGLMSYGPDIGATFYRAAGYVDKILKGARPATLPIEQPTKWSLVVNLRTAQTLGIKIPGTVLVRADELIQ